jgi:hypothetical protein
MDGDDDWPCFFICEIDEKRRREVNTASNPPSTTKIFEQRREKSQPVNKAHTSAASMAIFMEIRRLSSNDGLRFGRIVVIF